MDKKQILEALKGLAHIDEGNKKLFIYLNQNPHDKILDYLEQQHFKDIVEFKKFLDFYSCN